jgi:hypothetical protein
LTIRAITRRNVPDARNARIGDAAIQRTSWRLSLAGTPRVIAGSAINPRRRTARKEAVGPPAIFVTSS